MYTYLKFILVFVFIAICVKFATNIITFNTNDCGIKEARKSAILSLLIVTLEIIISIIYLLYVKKYLLDVSQIEKLLSQSSIYFLLISLVLANVIFKKQAIVSVGITKTNLFKSIIIGILVGLIFFILVRNFFNIKIAMDIISIPSFNYFISFLIVGFVEKVIFRGYLQTRLISWIYNKRMLVDFSNFRALPFTQ